MKSRWRDEDVQSWMHDPLQMRVYSSRLLGQDSMLVMHGGGNTSVKMEVRDRLGDIHDVLYVKGSGWDLATIEARGFAPVRLEPLRKMARLDVLSDRDMVELQRAAMLDPNAPNPSVEAILHAMIPQTFVDHTHADAVLAISHSPRGNEILAQIYGERVLIFPYVMPGFVLAQDVAKRTASIDWDDYDGMILLHHGVFTWADDAKTSYERMICIVDRAEQYLRQQGAWEEQVVSVEPMTYSSEHLLMLARLRREVSRLRGQAVVALWDHSAKARGISSRPSLRESINRGPLTPDHVIRTKPAPLHLSGNVEAELEHFAISYRAYFERHQQGHICLDLAPRWAIWPSWGTLAFGTSVTDASILQDIQKHILDALSWSEHLGGWYPIAESDLFAMEYWELEQAKLKKKNNASFFQAKIVLVTGAASGIGRACVERLVQDGAVVVALDIEPQIESLWQKPEILPIICDITDAGQVEQAIQRTVAQFGGLDMLISNAGNFPKSCPLADMNEPLWQKSLQLNLTSHQQLLTLALPYLRLGLDPAAVIVASKNVPAPGPGAAAYSVAKAGLTQLARIAALEWGTWGIRVNVVHPNAVFDTGIWTEQVIAERAQRYGLSVEEYQTQNVLKTQIRSSDVAETIRALLSPAFAKTTGTQIPIDGGNERVI